MDGLQWYYQLLSNLKDGREPAEVQARALVLAVSPIRLAQDMASMSSSERLPGTIVTGIRSLPIIFPVNEETSGPGPP